MEVTLEISSSGWCPGFQWSSGDGHSSYHSFQDHPRLGLWLVKPQFHASIFPSTNSLAVCQNLVPLLNIKIAGKWMFIPLKMVLIGIDPYHTQLTARLGNLLSTPRDKTSSKIFHHGPNISGPPARSAMFVQTWICAQGSCFQSWLVGWWGKRWQDSKTSHFINLYKPSWYFWQSTPHILMVVLPATRRRLRKSHQPGGWGRPCRLRMSSDSVPAIYRCRMVRLLVERTCVFCEEYRNKELWPVSQNGDIIYIYIYIYIQLYNYKYIYI